MAYQKEYQIKEPKESLHWLSASLKKILDEITRHHKVMEERDGNRGAPSAYPVKSTTKESQDEIPF